MGVAAYNRGTMVLRRRLDLEYQERLRQRVSNTIRVHEYIDWRNGETVRIAYDNIGPIVNQAAYFELMRKA